jgi:hypothetical protein
MSALKWAVISLLMALLLASSFIIANAESKPGSVVKIDAPKTNGTAGPTEPVRGRAQLSKGESLWIVPYDPAAGRYYLSASPVRVRSDGTWSTRLSVANVFRVGKTFQIYAVIADSSANSSLGIDAASQSGITKLPAGAKAVDAVTVTRVAADTAGAAASRSATASATNSTAAPSATGTNLVARSRNSLPGFEAAYALGSLAIVFAALRLRRQI